MLETKYIPHFFPGTQKALVTSGRFIFKTIAEINSNRYINRYNCETIAVIIQKELLTLGMIRKTVARIVTTTPCKISIPTGVPFWFTFRKIGEGLRFPLL